MELSTMSSSRRPHMEDVSPTDLRLYNPENPINSPARSRFFVIKCEKCDYDPIFHWSKYKAFTDAVQGSRILNRTRKSTKGPVLLIFSVCESFHFHGIAEMTSCVDFSISIDDKKEFVAMFDVRWLYVKDVPNTELTCICTPLKTSGKVLTRSGNCEEVGLEGGMKVVLMFHVYKHRSGVFDYWGYYQNKEQETRRRFSEEAKGCWLSTLKCVLAYVGFSCPWFGAELLLFWFLLMISCYLGLGVRS